MNAFDHTISLQQIHRGSIMRNNKRGLWLSFVFLAFLVVSQASLAATASMQQTIELKPGWNAIYVELEPDNNDITSIFAGIPVASVWRWLPKELGQDFIQDPAEGLLSLDGWFGYYPEPRPEAFLTNLFTLSANTAYLVKLDDTVNHSITITGSPILRKKRWNSNGFTLTGISVVPGNEPTFGEFFAASNAHNGQPIYKLDTDGRWRVVANPFVETINSGESYWIFTQGPSNYQGLLDITLQQGESLDYRTVFTELDFVISNLSDVSNFVTLSRASGVRLPMKFLNVDPETGEEAWPTLPDNKVYELQPGEDIFITLAVDRLNFTEERMEQIFSISSEQGVRYLMEAGGDTIQPRTPATRGALARRGVAQVPESNAGLWIGTANVRAVSEAQTAGTEPTPVGKPFVLRMIMHVDSTGTVRLLKNVVQMWQDGTYTTSDSNPDFLEVETPGFYVLLTDDSLIPNYSGVTMRSGQAAGIRYSTIAYDFNGNEIEMNGELAINNSLNVSLLVESEMPTNPFLHKFHPDHDNLDAQFLNFSQEAFQVTREMEFTFSPNNPNYPDTEDPPGWGVQEMGGTFRESISGLHKNTIFVEGDFRLRRVAATPVLNQ